MPELIIETNLEAAAAKRRVAKAVAVFMHREGVPLAHSIVRFRAVAESDVFTGPYSFATVSNGDGGSFAFVTCRIARSRDDDFRRRLAVVIAESLVPPVTFDRLFVAFDPVDPDDHLRGHDVADWKEAVRK